MDETAYLAENSREAILAREAEENARGECGTTADYWRDRAAEHWSRAATSYLAWRSLMLERLRSNGMLPD